MGRVSIYLNFPGNTEEAFTFYKSIFGGEFIGGISRFGDLPTSEEGSSIDPGLRDQIMHIQLSILGGTLLMGTDAPEAMGFRIRQGNQVYINLEPDTREETQRLFNALSEGGEVEQELQDMFWGAYYGSCRDKYGIQWMFNCVE